MDRKCDKCNTALVGVFPHSGRRITDLPQYEDALVIDFIGGYGMYIDTIDSGNPRLIFCHKCSNEVYSWFRNFLGRAIID